jgi:GcrA cell cycle regulator
MDLRDTMCRWPLGDPTSVDFRYCGSRSGPLGPYCEEHAQLAFQPTQERRRADRMVRIA